MTKKKYPNFLSICLIAKDEARYFREWIEYHKMMGVDKFYIYDNESSDGTREILQPYIDSGLVEYKYWPGQKMQIPAYKDCVRRHRRDTEWLAVIDMDEFIVPIKHESIPAFIKELGQSPSLATTSQRAAKQRVQQPKVAGTSAAQAEGRANGWMRSRRGSGFDAVEINWLTYGSGGHDKHTDGFIIERFRDHSLPEWEVNRWVKTIANPRKIWASLWGYGSVHKPVMPFGRVIDAAGNRTSGITTDFRKRAPIHDTIRINHYAVRSREEYMEKIRRGRADRFADVPRKMDWFEKHDRNEVKNDPIMDKHAKALRKILGEK